jgi:hypothetical protein
MYLLIATGRDLPHLPWQPPAIRQVRFQPSVDPPPEVWGRAVHVREPILLGKIADEEGRA